jgi:integrase
MVEKGGGGKTVASKVLTQRYLETLRPSTEAFKVKDALTPGLSFRVATDGAITAYVACRVKGASKGISSPIGIFLRADGRSGDKSLQELRDRANEITKAARAGRNIIKEEVAATVEAERAITVRQLINRYVSSRVKGKLRTAAEIERRLLRALEPIESQKAEQIRRRDIITLLDEVAEDGREREAEKRRQTIGAMFRWAISKDLIQDDPTAGIPVYDPGTPRDRVLSEEEIRNLWRFLESAPVPEAHANVLRLQLLLGARVGEIAGMTGQEIDEGSWIWTLPAARSKNGKPRATPLVGRARDIVAARLSAGPLFLTERRTPLSASTMGSWVRSMRAKITPEHFGTHDLRRTVASMLDDMGVPRDVIGALIGHESGERNATVLRRHYLKTEGIEKKKSALLAWDARLRLICSPDQAGAVVPFRRP